MSTLTADIFAARDHQDDDDRPDGDDREQAKESQATALVRLVTEAGAELSHTPGGDGYITIRVGGHREHHRLESRGCRDYLTRLYYLESQRAPNATALQAAIATLSGIARFDGAVHDVHLRVAEGHDGRLYLDLCDLDWRAIEITAIDWRIVTDPPVRFRRAKGMLPLPAPESDWSINLLREFVNVESDTDFMMVTAWLLAALRPSGPYPILVLMAEQGAAKTTTSRVLRRLLDPNESDARRPPRNVEDLMIAATNGHVVTFDNLSRLPEDLSDNLSVLATGGGFSVRQLFTNGEEHIFNAQRPIVLNGIAQIATRGDLLDRAIVLTLPPIADDDRRDEREFWTAFETARPRILGALLNAMVTGIRRLPTTRLAKKPRMADFALWVTAAEESCPWAAGEFLAAYVENRHGAVVETLDGDPVVELLSRHLPPSWIGTATELLAILNTHTAESVKQRKGWYPDGTRLSNALRRLAPALRRIGINVTFLARRGTGRPIAIERVAPAASSASPASPSPDLQGFSGDADGDAGDTAPSASPAASPKNSNVYGLSDAGDADDAENPTSLLRGEDGAQEEDPDGF